MITQIVDPDHFHGKARQIRTRLPTILSQWGLSPKFNRWQLTQDPDSGMVVLFANLNTRYITTHTATPFSNYFDPLLLHYLADDLRIQVASCVNDCPRYAFILDTGKMDMVPAPIDFPFLDGDRLFQRAVNRDKPVPDMMEPQITLTPLITADMVVDQTIVNQLGKDSLKVFDEI